LEKGELNFGFYNSTCINWRKLIGKQRRSQVIDLKNVVAEEMDRTANLILSYPWHDPVSYAMWLAQTYYMVCHSTRLVALAGACCPLEKNKLHARFVDHSKEERGHEKVCISDLNELGYELLDFPQIYQSAAMYQIQYYWIQYRDPVSFFGYTLGLECLAEHFGPRLHEMATKAHGAAAAKFLRLHSEADVEHTQEAYKHLQDLSASERILVKENLNLSCEIYRGMLTESQNRGANLEPKRAVAS